MGEHLNTAPARLAPGRMVAEPGLFYVPAVNEMSAAMTASFLAFAGLLPCDSGFETSFRGPRQKAQVSAALCGAGSLGTTSGVPRYPVRRCGGTLDSAPS